MRRGQRILVGLLIAVTALFPITVEAGLGRAVARGAAKSTARTLGQSTARVLRRDIARDSAIKARPLASQRTVFRYTLRKQAAAELQSGIPAGRHMTANGGPGRPLGAPAAQKRYGLPERPQVRETIRVPQGQPVRSAKALSGEPGVGEMTSTERIPPAAITNVVQQ